MTKQIMAFHGGTGEEIYFDAGTDPRWAVAYGYCTDHNLMSWLFKMAQDLKMEEAYKDLPMEYGKISVCCGDWLARRNND